MLSADALFLKDQNQSNFFCSYFPHENTEDVSREAQSIAAQLLEPAHVPNSIWGVL